ncbi:Ribonuclease H-like protein [Dioscorea alata]|uniref:Ribonuclease H-like protein n=1 Tax=Dioscorea alata TaxID=55571 RepID=A0ACB7V5S4_DIOAL|nr:Ribonuclease H-like protein [Dioscorea alata]
MKPIVFIVIFSGRIYRSEKGASGIFTRKWFSSWRKALESFNQHVCAINSAHNNARRHCEDFKNQRQSVSHVLSSHGRQMEIDYRSRLIIVLDVVRILLVQGIAFRGHDESSSSKNKGNFLEILNWYAKKVEEVGNVINENALGNNQLTSPLIQKQLVNVCDVVTTLATINEIGDNNFSLIVDESRDKSIKEQMTVILRFLAIQHVTDTSAFSLKVTLYELFACYGLSISKLRGQEYDGASNMRGEFNGLKTLILKENPFAFYVHYFPHQLQLVVVSVAKSILVVSDFFCYTNMIVNIMGASCKRKDALLQTHRQKIVERLEAVLEVLQNVCQDGSIADQKGLASSLISKMESFEFLFVLHLMMKLLGITNELSNVLQNSFSIFNHAKLLRLAEIYYDDFSIQDLQVLKEQLHTYIHNVRRCSNFVECDDLASLAVKLVEKLALILLVAIALVERSFSAMNIIKTDLRNKIRDEWLNDMMICYIERQVFQTIDDEAILVRFQNMQSRRIQLPLR